MSNLLETGRRVLAVDDDPGVLALVETRLKQIGCVTATACDGHDAIAKITTFDPEALVLDLSMPGLDGFGVLDWMATRGLTAQVRTLVLTARNHPGDVGRALELGARDYLAKPFRDDQFLLRVARLLVRSREALNR